MIRTHNTLGITIALGLSAAALVSAQTVPGRAWIGPPAQFGAAHAGTAAQATQFTAAAQAAPVAEPAEPAAGMVQRAMAQADRNLWLRAGLGDLGEFDDSVSPTYRERLARYERMRDGPEFALELARVNGRAATASLGAPGAGR